MAATAATHQNSNRGMEGNRKRAVSFSLVLTLAQMAADTRAAPTHNPRSQPNVSTRNRLSTSVIAGTASPHVTAAARKDTRQRDTTPPAREFTTDKTTKKKTH